MKTATIYRNEKTVRYPNAATRRELLHKALDTALVTASGIGIGAIIALMTVI